MKGGMRRIAPLAASLALLTLAACTSSIDEMILNPNTKAELIDRLLGESLAKEQIMKRLTTDDETKRELAETLLRDTSIKALALDRLTTDRLQRDELIKRIVSDADLRSQVAEAIAADKYGRAEVKLALKKPLK